MLASLARWLRAAGHDTALAGQAMLDQELLARCRDEGRTLLTRDHALAGAAGGRCTALLLPDRLDDQARMLAAELGLDWAFAPFSRCIVDNVPLRAATPEEVAAVPEPFRRRADEVKACPACGRVYWPGGHVRRMAERLERWRTGF